MQTNHKNKLVLQPKDYIVFVGGLKLENVGDMVIKMKLPPFFEIEPVKKFRIEKFKLSER